MRWISIAGSEGWQLVRVVDSNGELSACLKRPILPGPWAFHDDEEPASHLPR